MLDIKNNAILLDNVEERARSHNQKIRCALRFVLFPDEAGCRYECEKCIKESVDRLYKLTNVKCNNTCKDCVHLIGRGDLGAYCDIKYELVFENSLSCSDFLSKKHA